MINNLFCFATFVAALGCGLIAGVFFAFSAFVMKALVALPPSRGITAMQSINVVVINPWFLGAFLGTGMVCSLLAASSLFRWNRPGSAWLIMGSMLYLFGTVMVTMACNVPLNATLAAVDPANDEAISVWTEYVSRWTMWNHVRTGAALAAAGSLTVAFRLLHSPDTV